LSLAQLQEVPSENMILLVGAPGSGKSSFCQQAVLNNISIKPVIYVTTETSPSKVEDSLREKGLVRMSPHPIGYVDAFHETVGLITEDRPDTEDASSDDLTSLGIAIYKLGDRMKEKSLLVFDSLTSPYLMSGSEILRFMRTTLIRFAAEGNSVLACIDEGCGSQEDLVAMMSLSDGVIKTEIERDRQLLDIVKHPRLRPSTIEIPTEPKPSGLKFVFESDIMDFRVGKQCYDAVMRGNDNWMRKGVGDYVNLFWPNLVTWSGMLWDPKRFPTLKYELDKLDGTMAREIIQFYPWHERLQFKFMPKDLNKVNIMKKMFNIQAPWGKAERSGIMVYLEDASKTDEHYFRVHENYACWGFDDVGSTISSFYAAACTAGTLKGFEEMKGLERDWNAVETKCIGLGDPYCEFKLVPGEIDELSHTLEKDSAFVDNMQERLLNRLMKFLLHGEHLVERPRLGSDIHLHAIFHATGFSQLTNERYQTALRMGGTKAGKEVGERLMEAGIREDEAVKRILNLLEYCKVGEVTVGDKIRIKDNCESIAVNFIKTRFNEPSCYFTTGFLNGFFSTVKNQHVKETRCIAMGDPYCEWEFR
jgi:predicted hydrocarbon binding protein/KaiC/GvpD/RAD55 family RecA-like ATPase